MYIYNVTIKITPSIEAEWLQWMQTEHLQEVISTEKFDSYSLHELIEPEDEDGKTFVVQYFTTTQERYMCYINEHAPLLREKGFAKFGNQFIAFRSVMKIIEQG